MRFIPLLFNQKELSNISNLRDFNELMYRNVLNCYDFFMRNTTMCSL